MPDPIRRNLTLAQLNASPPLNLVPADAKVSGVPGTGDPLGPDPLGVSLEGAKNAFNRYVGLLSIGAVDEAKALQKLIPESWLRAFHGSPARFNEFDFGKVGTTTDKGFLGHAAYFSTDPKVAAHFPHQYAADLRVSNPLRVSMTQWGQDKAALVRSALGLPETASPQEMTAVARSKGHDSVVLDYSPLGYRHQEIAVFEPQQIRLTK